jgi:hypothetical protein
MQRLHEGSAWVVAVDMGYGHQRAANAVAFLSPDKKVITANNYPGIPDADRRIWARDAAFYYFVSRLKSRGVLGRFAFNAFDRFQRIGEFYPFRRGAAPTFQLSHIYRAIRGGWGRHLIERLAEHPRPLITPFFTVAFMAEEWRYPGPIYAIVTDADISRAWAPLEPSKSVIRYCASTERVVERLQEYGVPADHIHFTGFPLPCALVGADSAIAKRALRSRLERLDPERRYRSNFESLIASHLGRARSAPGGVSRPVALTFAVGGAGAQAEIGVSILQSLKDLIEQRKLSLRLVAGVSQSAAELFTHAAREFGLQKHLGDSLQIIYADTKDEYFARFNETIATTDILWTKPSELSFFAALGLPIVVAPPIGSQEVQNRKWLLYLGAGLDELDPRFAHEWLPDLISSGKLAETAMQGFIKMEREGAAAIARLVGAPTHTHALDTHRG